MPAAGGRLPPPGLRPRYRRPCRVALAASWPWPGLASSGATVQAMRLRWRSCTPMLQAARADGTVSRFSGGTERMIFLECVGWVRRGEPGHVRVRRVRQTMYQVGRPALDRTGRRRLRWLKASCPTWKPSCLAAAGMRCKLRCAWPASATSRAWCHPVRLHSSLGYRSPMTHEPTRRLR